MKFTASADDDGLRPDRALRQRFDLDRQGALKLLKSGKIVVAGERARLSTTLTTGDLVEVDARLHALGDSPRVLFEGRGVLAIEKPAGLPMHEGTGVSREDDTLRAWVCETFNVEQPSFLGRLDRPTSGLVLCATSREGLAAIEPAWSSGSVEKLYRAIVHGQARAKGTIKVDLAARRQRHKGTGRRERAITRYRSVARAKVCSDLEVVIETGRTHQIRRHMKSIRHPLVGDKRYGDLRREVDLERALELEEGALKGQLMLHCHRLTLPENIAGLPRVMESEVPTRMTELWDRIARA